MNFTTLLVACASWVVWQFIFLLWTGLSTSVPARPAGDKGCTISGLLLALYVFVPAVFGDFGGSSLNRLVTQGLSIQNEVQVVVSLTALAWAGSLLATRTVIPSSLVAGVNFWIGLSLVLWGLSTLWSLWPTYTAYRTIELGAFWVLSMHLFSGRPPLVRLTWCLLVYAILSLSAPLSYFVQHPGIDISELRFQVRQDDAGMVTGALIVTILYRLIILKQINSVQFFVPAVVLFGWYSSLASTLAVFLAILTLAAFRVGRHAGRFVQLLTIAFILPLAGFLLYELVFTNLDATTWLAWVTDHDPRSLTNGTGRLEIWENLFKVAKNNKFGYGFGAGDRLLYQISGLTVGNTHNGFIAAWMAAGWLGVWTVIYMLAATIHEAVRRGYGDCSYMLSLVVFLTINNLTLPGIGGGVFNIGWFLIIILACAGPITMRPADNLHVLYRTSRTSRQIPSPIRGRTKSAYR